MADLRKKWQAVKAKVDKVIKKASSELASEVMTELDRFDRSMNSKALQISELSHKDVYTLFNLAENTPDFGLDEHDRVKVPRDLRRLFPFALNLVLRTYRDYSRTVGPGHRRTR